MNLTCFLNNLAASKKAKGGKLNPKGLSEKQIEDMVDDAVGMIEEIQNNGNGIEKSSVEIKASKPLSQVKKGDKIIIDGNEYEVDAHYVLIDHGGTKEMAVELFNVSDEEVQLRYFNDQVESTLELYELEEIMYLKKPMKKIEW